MFHFPRSTLLQLCIHYRIHGVNPCEFPHSEIFGSLAMCAYPKLIAAYHVLHRLLMPRHSPYALYNLTYCRWTINCVLLCRLRRYRCSRTWSTLCSSLLVFAYYLFLVPLWVLPIKALKCFFQFTLRFYNTGTTNLQYCIFSIYYSLAIKLQYIYIN